MVTECRKVAFLISAGVPRGTIITSVNGRPVNTLAELDNALASSRSMVRLDGITPDGTGFVFNFPLGA